MSEPEAAQMPEKYIEAKPRRFEELQVGESGYLLFTTVFVDEERRVFVSDFRPELQKRGMSTVGVRREADGFVLIVPRDDKTPFTWRPGPLPKSGKCYPVVRIEEEG